MSETKVNVCLTNPKNGKKLYTDMLVDTGSEVTTITEDIAKTLGLDTRNKETVLLYDDKKSEFKTSRAEINIEGRSTPIKVYIVGRPTEMILGVNVIESLGFNINPVSARLVKRDLRFPFRGKRQTNRMRT